MKNSGQSRILILIVVFSMMSGCLDDGVEAIPDEVTGEEGIEKSYSVVAPVEYSVNDILVV